MFCRDILTGTFYRTLGPIASGGVTETLFCYVLPGVCYNSNVLKRQDSYRIPFYVVLLCLSIAAVAAIGFATVWGSAIAYDSMVYIDSARHLLRGQGLSLALPGGSTAPLTHFPPLFPLTLAGLGLLGMDPWTGARWLNAACLGLNVLLIGLVVRRATGSTWLPLFGAVLTLTSVDMNAVHTAALTEPLYLLVSTLGLLWLDVYLEDRRPVYFVLSAFAVSLSWLTRYAGGALVIAGAGALLAYAGPTWRRRFRDAAIFSAAACLPMLLWVARNRWVAQTLTNRSIAFHPITADQAFAATATFARWFAPPPIPEDLIKPIALVGTIFLCGLIAWAVMRKPGHLGSERGDRFLAVLILYLASYSAFLLVSISFFDALMPLGWRLLAPIFVAGLIMILCLADRLSPIVRRHRSLQIGAVAIGLIIAATYVGTDAASLLDAHREGRFFSTPDWAQSPLLEKVAQFPSDACLYSNTPDVIQLYLGRLAYGFPVKRNTAGDVPAEDYQAAMAAAAARLKSQSCVVVYFDTLKQHAWPSMPGALEDEITRAWRLRPIDRAADGMIYEPE